MSEFTLSLVNEAIALAVSKALPGVTVYDNPNQQGTRLPALFLTYRGEQRTENQLGGRRLRKLRYDLCYLERKNIPDAGDRFRRAAEALDEGMDTIPYADGRPLHTARRSWAQEGDELHYHFDLTARVVLPDESRPIKELDLKEGMS